MILVSEPELGSQTAAEEPSPRLTGTLNGYLRDMHSATLR